MTDRKSAAIEATYATYRPVPSRGVFQIVCELPIEQAEHALETLGQPGFAGKQVWVAIALMNKGATGERKDRPMRVTLGKYEGDSPVARAADKPKRDKLMSEKLALACKRPGFWEYLEGPGVIIDADHADRALKLYLGIQSKTECDVPGDAADAAKRLLDDYELKRKYAAELEKQG